MIILYFVAVVLTGYEQLLLAADFPASIVSSPAVRAELGIGDEQMEQIDELTKEFHKRRLEISRTVKVRSLEDRNAIREPLYAELEEEFGHQLADVLSVDQWKRYIQLCAWSRLLYQSRFSFFIDTELTNFLELSPTELEELKKAVTDVETRFNEACAKKLQSLQLRILGVLGKSKTDKIASFGLPHEFETGTATTFNIQKIDAQWDRDTQDNIFHASIPFHIHKLNNVAQLLKLDEATISKLEQLYADATDSKRTKIKEAKKLGPISRERQAKLELQAASPYQEILEQILTADQFEQHQKYQFQKRAFSLGMFRQYADPWLLRQLNVDSITEKELVELVSQCAIEFDEYLISRTRAGWKQIEAALPSDSLTRMRESLGETPVINMGYFRR